MQGNSDYKSRLMGNKQIFYHINESNLQNEENLINQFMLSLEPFEISNQTIEYASNIIKKVIEMANSGQKINNISSEAFRRLSYITTNYFHFLISNQINDIDLTHSFIDVYFDFLSILTRMNDAECLQCSPLMYAQTLSQYIFRKNDSLYDMQKQDLYVYIKVLQAIYDFLSCKPLTGSLFDIVNIMKKAICTNNEYFSSEEMKLHILAIKIFLTILAWQQKYIPENILHDRIPTANAHLLLFFQKYANKTDDPNCMNFLAEVTRELSYFFKISSVNIKTILCTEGILSFLIKFLGFGNETTTNSLRCLISFAPLGATFSYSILCDLLQMEYQPMLNEKQNAKKFCKLIYLCILVNLYEKPPNKMRLLRLYSLLEKTLPGSNLPLYQKLINVVNDACSVLSHDKDFNNMKFKIIIYVGLANLKHKRILLYIFQSFSDFLEGITYIVEDQNPNTIFAILNALINITEFVISDTDFSDLRPQILSTSLIEMIDKILEVFDKDEIIPVVFNAGENIYLLATTLKSKILESQQ